MEKRPPTAPTTSVVFDLTLPKPSHVLGRAFPDGDSGLRRSWASSSGHRRRGFSDSATRSSNTSGVWIMEDREFHRPNDLSVWISSSGPSTICSRTASSATTCWPQLSVSIGSLRTRSGSQVIDYPWVPWSPHKFRVFIF